MEVPLMTRHQSLTLSSLGIKWRLIGPNRFTIFLAGHEVEVSSYDEALSVAANFWGSL
jgi:hypothetical protein